MKVYSIYIEGFLDPKEFVEKWSNVYDLQSGTKYPDEKYENYIKDGINSESAIEELFKWKNGTGEKISIGKSTRIKEFLEKRNMLLELKESFEWNKFDQLFEPYKEAVIWKIFLLHIINPCEFPIYDQHVYRSFIFITKGLIEDRPESDKEYYEVYKFGYINWFNQLKNEYGLDHRKMDKSFFAFGKMLKSIKITPFMTDIRQNNNQVKI